MAAPRACGVSLALLLSQYNISGETLFEPAMLVRC